MSTFVETLARLQGDHHSLEALAHEARNMGTALGLYCELLAEPGVLAPGFQHYARELRTVAAASRRLMENLSLFEACPPAPVPAAQTAPEPVLRAPDFFPRAMQAATQSAGVRAAKARTYRAQAAKAQAPRVQAPRVQAPRVQAVDAGQGIATRWALLPALPIGNLAAELRSNRNLLAALAGPLIHLSMEIRGAALPVRLTGEDLTRVLVNLVKNAVEVMPDGGRMRVQLVEMEAASGAGRRLELAVEDSGTGISPEWLESIFEPGFTTRAAAGANHPEHRGVGLAVTRALVESAGGRIYATNREPAGATFRIELPVPEG